MIKEEEIKIIFAVDWWDGPLSGVCIYNGEKHWFQATDEWYEEDKPYWRRYAVIKLTPEQLAKEEAMHELYEEKIGDPRPYVDGVLTRDVSQKPKEMWHEFYDVYKGTQLPDYRENVVDYFEV